MNASLVMISGSPPLMREGRGYGRRILFTDGITPAYAGRTFIVVVNVYSIWDHPRLCGKDEDELLSLIADWGSPPLMREGQ